MPIKSFDTFQEMEAFASQPHIRAFSVQRIEERDFYTAPGNPLVGSPCNTWVTWVLVYECTEVNDENKYQRKKDSDTSY